MRITNWIRGEKILKALAIIVCIGYMILLWSVFFLRDDLSAIRSGISALLLTWMFRPEFKDDSKTEKIKELETENKFLRKLLKDPDFRRGVFISSKGWSKEENE